MFLFVMGHESWWQCSRWRALVFKRRKNTLEYAYIGDGTSFCSKIYPLAKKLTEKSKSSYKAITILNVDLAIGVHNSPGYILCREYQNVRSLPFLFPEVVLLDCLATILSTFNGRRGDIFSGQILRPGNDMISF